LGADRSLFSNAPNSIQYADEKKMVVSNTNTSFFKTCHDMLLPTEAVDLMSSPFTLVLLPFEKLDAALPTNDLRRPI
jgi:hypothetical protein